MCLCWLNLSMSKNGERAIGSVGALRPVSQDRQTNMQSQLLRALDPFERRALAFAVRAQSRRWYRWVIRTPD